MAQRINGRVQANLVRNTTASSEHSERRERLAGFLESKRNRRLTILVLSLAEVCLVIGIGLVLLKLSNRGLRLNNFTVVPVTGGRAVTSTPAPACLRPVLALGAVNFQVQPIQRAGDGTVAIPADIPGKAFWVGGTTRSLVFGLSPFSEEQAFETSLHEGDPITITWADCSTDTYVIKTIAAGGLDPAVLFDQSTPGVRVFVPRGDYTTGFVIQGVRPAVPTDSLARCNGPALRIGPLQFRLKPVAPGADGTYSSLAPEPTAANWYQGAAAEYVFSIGASPENLDLERSLQVGDQVAISAADCRMTTFTLSEIDHGAAYTPSRAARPAVGVILFVQTADPGLGFVVQGGPVAENVNLTPTPAPGVSPAQAETTILETISPADDSTLSVRVSIRNNGASAFPITANDVRLVPKSGAPLSPLFAVPALPQTVRPGITKEFIFTFHRPAADQAVLKILGVENNLEGY